MEVSFTLLGERRVIHKVVEETYDAHQTLPETRSQGAFTEGLVSAGQVYANSEPMPQICKPLRGVCESDSDCLPLGAKVQVLGSDGQPRHVAVEELRGDEHVLCLDHLTSAGHFVPLQSISVDPGPSVWSRVTLEDGTSLELTADHPIRGKGWPSKVAADLQPGVDSLVVAKTQPQTVKNVVSINDARGRVSLSIVQAFRFSLFVHYPEALDTAVAVEFANFENIHLHTRGACLDVQTEEFTDQTSVARTAPPDLCQEHAASSTERFSLGTTEHIDGHCPRPCRFQFNHQRKPLLYGPCKNGRSCAFCHDLHSDECMRWVRRHGQRAKPEGTQPHNAYIEL